MTTLTKKDEAESVGPSGAPSAHTPDVAELLRRARHLIAAEGAWGQGNGSNAWPRLRQGCFCADTALHEMSDGFGDLTSKTAQRLLRVAVGIDPAPTWSHAEFYRWHDHPARTQAEVVAAFDRAIALSEGNAAESRPQGDPHGK